MKANDSTALSFSASAMRSSPAIADCYPVTMRPVKEIRRNKLALLEKGAGSRVALADQLGKNRNQIYQWLLDGDDTTVASKSKRGISDEVARDIERKLGLPVGWMDHEDQDGSDAQIGSMHDRVTLAYLESYIEPGGAHSLVLPRQLFATRPDLLEPYIRVVWKEPDDMRDEIEVGELLFVDTRKTASPPAHDGIYAYRLSKHPFIKRIKNLGNGGYRLQGTRPQTDSIDLFDEDLRALVAEGRVVSKLACPITI